MTKRRAAVKPDLLRFIENQLAESVADFSKTDVSNAINDDGAVVIAGLLMYDKSITTYLDLRDNSVGTAGVTAIVESLKTNHTLEDLDLSSNPFVTEENGLETLLKALAENTIHLTDLELDVCDLGKREFRMIADMLRTNTSLEIISLQHNNATFEDADALEKAASERGVPITIDLSHNELTRGDFMRLNAQIIQVNKEGFLEEGDGYEGGDEGKCRSYPPLAIPGREARISRGTALLRIAGVGPLVGVRK